MPRVKVTLPESFLFTVELPIRITDLNYGAHLGNDALLSLLHEARVKFLAHLGQPEQVGGVGGVSELERRGLVDRYGPGPGRRVRLSPDMDLTCLETPLFTHVRHATAPNPDPTSRISGLLIREEDVRRWPGIHSATSDSRSSVTGRRERRIVPSQPAAA